MSLREAIIPADSATFFRRVLLAFAALLVAATGVELAMERHWNTFVQQIPWGGVGLMLIAIGLASFRPRRPSLIAARALSVAIIALSLYGIFEHVQANYDAGPLDFRYANSWATMSEAGRWLRAATKSVGPAPVLAPGILAQAALCVIAATLRHPASRSR